MESSISPTGDAHVDHSQLKSKFSKKLQKSVSDLICRVKSQTPNLHIASTTNRILNGCRRPKSLPLYANSHRLRRRKSGQSDESESESAAGGGQIGKTAATLEDIDRFLFENFSSLYRGKYDSDREEEDEESETPATYDSSHRSFETPDLTPGDLCDSRRFFISPASSPSVTEEARTSRARSDDAGWICSTITSASASKTACLTADPARGSFEKASGGGAKAKQSLPGENCIAVLKASADPLEDFRRSMGGVMEARARHGEMVDWGFMEELLFCYLRMNEKKHYRFVLDAFVDSVVDMRRSSCDGGGSSGGATEEEVAQKETWKKKGKERKEDIDNLI